MCLMCRSKIIVESLLLHYVKFLPSFYPFSWHSCSSGDLNISIIAMAHLIGVLYSISKNEVLRFCLTGVISRDCQNLQFSVLNGPILISWHVHIATVNSRPPDFVCTCTLVSRFGMQDIMGQEGVQQTLWRIYARKMPLFKASWETHIVLFILDHITTPNFFLHTADYNHPTSVCEFWGNMLVLCSKN